MQTPVQTSGYVPAVVFYGVVCDPLEGAVELFRPRGRGDRAARGIETSPDQAGALRIEKLEFETSPN